MSGIDYSKWDNLDDYSDSDEEEETSAPRVTTLDGPSTVTFGGGSANIQANVSTAESKAPDAPSNSNINREMQTKWTDKGSMITIEDGESKGKKLFWCQDRYSVTLRLQLDNEQKGSELQVTATNVVAFEDRHCAVGSTKPHLTITAFKSGASSKILLEGDTPHPIHYGHEEDSLEWNIERDSNDQKYLTLLLYKAVPMQGLFVWWKRPFLHCAEIELEEASQSSGTSTEFTKAWEEAHRLFREKRASSKH